MKPRLTCTFFLLRCLILGVGLLSLSACVTNTALREQHATVQHAGYAAAAHVFLDEKGNVKVDAVDLHELLVVGKSLHDAGMWAKSNAVLAQAAKALTWKEDTIDTPEEALRFVGTILTNDTFGAYVGKIYEGVMLDYYMAINFVMLGDEVQARVHFNRLAERQGNAEIQLRAYTKSLKDTDTLPENKKDRELVSKSIKKSDVNFHKGLEKLPENLMAAQIRVPSGDLMNAVFRKTSSARSDKYSDKAKDAINAVQAMAPDTETRRFAETLERSFLETKDEHVFVLYEYGIGPSIDEFRVNLPLFLVNSNVLYSGVALPEFVPGQGVNPGLLVMQDKSSAELVQVTDLNRIASLEFSSSYDAKVGKEITRAILKTVAQGVLNKQIDEEASGLAGLLMKATVAVAQAALTQADTRCWSNLPNQIQMAVLKKAGVSDIVMSTKQGRQLVSVPSLPGDQLVYMRQQSSGGDLKVFSQRLPARSLSVEIDTANPLSPAEITGAASVNEIVELPSAESASIQDKIANPKQQFGKPKPVELSEDEKPDGVNASQGVIMPNTPEDSPQSPNGVKEANPELDGQDVKVPHAIYIGAYSQASVLKEMGSRIKHLGLSFYVQPIPGRSLTRLFVGPFNDRAEADVAKHTIEKSLTDTAGIKIYPVSVIKDRVNAEKMAVLSK
ncbi:Sporulation domain protein [Magnetococcus marinus MC-1]|uniref:Sporulation domain protein n=1 Tax=Magnetococcus marinus (strain ATCC BAA-1437 / JCM 17883 / MC-1) TaxID=156889 RepID=A0LBE4_MAGMM|nr:SPOR domain-containing protein [Magnetococcus marinus]ABK45287.1 Sporulation domain protein [Magnetococcus marinus MC-1]